MALAHDAMEPHFGTRLRAQRSTPPLSPRAPTDKVPASTARNRVITTRPSSGSDATCAWPTTPPSIEAADARRTADVAPGVHRRRPTPRPRRDRPASAYLRARSRRSTSRWAATVTVRVGEPGNGAGARWRTRLARRVGRRDGRLHPERTRARRARGAIAGTAGLAVALRRLALRRWRRARCTTAAGTPCRVFGAFSPRLGRQSIPVPASPRRAACAGRRSVTSSLDDAERAVRQISAVVLRRTCPTARRGAAGGRRSGGRTSSSRGSRRVDDYDAPTRPARARRDRADSSPYLRFGSLHPRQVLDALDGGVDGSRGRFRTEICWREFYADVLWHQPESVREVTAAVDEHLRVDRDERARRALSRRGRAARPATRWWTPACANSSDEGWMHNRVRMVVRVFPRQAPAPRLALGRAVVHVAPRRRATWPPTSTAGSGRPAPAPTRRPSTGSSIRRCKPSASIADGVYVRRYVSELASVDRARSACEPGGWRGAAGPANYPAPMVDAGRRARRGPGPLRRRRAVDGAVSDTFGVYVHVPFCAHRCDYCAFATYADRDQLMDDYVDAVVDRDRAGATSGLARGDVGVLRRRHAVAARARAAAARSSTRSRARRRRGDRRVQSRGRQPRATASRIARGGVTRMSFGVQSTRPAVLADLGRRHGTMAHEEVVARRHEAGFATWNMDLIVGSRAETLDDVRAHPGRPAVARAPAAAHQLLRPDPRAGDAARARPRAPPRRGRDRRRLRPGRCGARGARLPVGGDLELGPARSRVSPQPRLLGPGRLRGLRLGRALAPSRTALLERAHARSLHRHGARAASAPRR